MENKKYLIIYHKEDNDGVFSGAIFKDYLLNVLNVSEEKIDLLPADYNILSNFAQVYNDPLSLKELYSHIIMTDLSFNDYKYMIKLYNVYQSDFIWVDHHAPIIQCSIDKNFDSIPGLRDTSRSAILCAWKYLYDQFDEAYNQKRVPELFRILSGWDSWTYKKEGYEFEYVKNINKGITNRYNLDIDIVLKLIKDLRLIYLNNEQSGRFSVLYKDSYLIKEVYKEGKLFNEYEDKIMENIIKTSGDCSWKIRFEDEDKGHPLYHSACAIFHQGASNSTMFKCLKNKGIHHGLVFKHQPNGNWVLSMYNINEEEWTHCGEFLKERYNGGGHKGAAGCTLSENQFIKILKDKIL